MTRENSELYSRTYQQAVREAVDDHGSYENLPLHTRCDLAMRYYRDVAPDDISDALCGDELMRSLSDSMIAALLHERFAVVVVGVIARALLTGSSAALSIDVAKELARRRESPAVDDYMADERAADSRERVADIRAALR